MSQSQVAPLRDSVFLFFGDGAVLAYSGGGGKICS